MALWWMEGFESVADDGQMALLYDATYTSIDASSSPQTGRVFGLSWRTPAGGTNLFVTPAHASTHSTVIFGMAFKIDGAVLGGSCVVFQARAAADVPFYVTLEDGQQTGYLKFVAYGGPTTPTAIGESEEFEATGEWRRVEIKVLLDASVGTVEIRLDSVVVLDLSSVCTTATGLDEVDQVGFGIAPAAGVTADIDDIYVLDDDKPTSLLVDFLGDVVVKGVFPSSDGTPDEWSPSTGTDDYAVVDNSANESSPGSDYTEAVGGSGGQQYLGFESLEEIKGDVLCIMILMLAKLFSAGSHLLRIHLKENDDTDTLIGSHTINSTSYDYFVEIESSSYVETRRLAANDLESAEVGLEAIT